MAKELKKPMTDQEIIDGVTQGVIDLLPGIVNATMQKFYKSDTNKDAIIVNLNNKIVTLKQEKTTLKGILANYLNS